MDKEHGRSVSGAGAKTASLARSSSDVMEGAQVLKEVGNLTGLPEEYLDSEITQLLGTTHESVNDLTLEQLRSVLMNYLETINEEMMAEQIEKH